MYGGVLKKLQKPFINVKIICKKEDFITQEL